MRNIVLGIEYYENSGTNYNEHIKHIKSYVFYCIRI